jgi:hypothetical protein
MTKTAIGDLSKYEIISDVFLGKSKVVPVLNYHDMKTLVGVEVQHSVLNLGTGWM